MKKFLSIMMAVAMCVALAAGCAPAAAPAEEAAPAGEAAPAEGVTAAAPAIKLGGIGPITGPAAIYGQAVKNAAELAVAEVNAMGGTQFELNFQDDAHDAETSVNAYGTLMDWGMQALVGPVTSTPAAAVAAEAANDNVFALTPSASSPSVTEGRTNVFQMCFTDPNLGVASADYIAAKGMGDAVAVIYNNGDAYSTGIYEGFAAQAEAKGVNVVYVGTFTDDSATDFSSQLTAAQQAGATTMFMPIYYTPISLIMTQAASMNYAVTYFGVDGMDGLLTLEGFDTALAEGSYLLTPFSADATDEKTTAFVANYKAAYGETPNQFAADAYDCVYAIYEACNATGVTGDTSASDMCDAFVAHFNGGFTFNGLTGTNMTWSASGEVSKEPMVIVIKGGAYATAE